MSTITTKDGTGICFTDCRQGQVVAFSRGQPLPATARWSAWARTGSYPRDVGNAERLVDSYGLSIT